MQEKPESHMLFLLALCTEITTDSFTLLQKLLTKPIDSSFDSELKKIIHMMDDRKHPSYSTSLIKLLKFFELKGSTLLTWADLVEAYRAIAEIHIDGVAVCSDDWWVHCLIEPSVDEKPSLRALEKMEPWQDFIASNGEDGYMPNPVHKKPILVCNHAQGRVYRFKVQVLDRSAASSYETTANHYQNLMDFLLKRVGPEKSIKSALTMMKIMFGIHPFMDLNTRVFTFGMLPVLLRYIFSGKSSDSQFFLPGTRSKRGVTARNILESFSVDTAEKTLITSQEKFNELLQTMHQTVRLKLAILWRMGFSLISWVEGIGSGNLIKVVDRVSRGLCSPLAVYRFIRQDKVYQGLVEKYINVGGGCGVNSKPVLQELSNNSIFILGRDWERFLRIVECFGCPRLNFFQMLYYVIFPEDYAIDGNEFCDRVSHFSEVVNNLIAKMHGIEMLFDAIRILKQLQYLVATKLQIRSSSVLDQEVEEAIGVGSKIIGLGGSDALFRPKKYQPALLMYDRQKCIAIFFILASSLEGHKIIAHRVQKLSDIGQKYLFLRIPCVDVPVISFFFFTYIGQQLLKSESTVFLDMLVQQFDTWNPRLLGMIFIELRQSITGRGLLVYQPFAKKLLQTRSSDQLKLVLQSFVFYPDLRKLLADSVEIRNFFNVEHWFSAYGDGKLKPIFIACIGFCGGRILIETVFNELEPEKLTKLLSSYERIGKLSHLEWLFTFKEGRQLLCRLSGAGNALTGEYLSDDDLSDDSEETELDDGHPDEDGLPDEPLMSELNLSEKRFQKDLSCYVKATHLTCDLLSHDLVQLSRSKKLMDMADILYENGQDDESFKLAFTLYVWAFNCDNNNEEAKSKIKMMLAHYDFDVVERIKGQIMKDSRFASIKSAPVMVDGVSEYSFVHFYWAGSHPGFRECRNLGRWSRHLRKTGFMPILWCNTVSFNAIQEAERNNIEVLNDSNFSFPQMPSMTYFFERTGLSRDVGEVFWWKSEADDLEKDEEKRCVFQRNIMVVNIEEWFARFMKMSSSPVFQANVGLIVKAYRALNSAGFFSRAKNKVVLIICCFMSGIYIDLDMRPPGKAFPMNLKQLANSIANDPEVGPYFLNVVHRLFKSVRVSCEGKFWVESNVTEDVQMWFSFFVKDICPCPLGIAEFDEDSCDKEVKAVCCKRRQVAKILQEFPPWGAEKPFSLMCELKYHPERLLERLKHNDSLPVLSESGLRESLINVTPHLYAELLFQAAYSVLPSFGNNSAVRVNGMIPIRLYQYFLGTLVEVLPHHNEPASLYCTPFQRLQNLQRAVRIVDRFCESRQLHG